MAPPERMGFAPTRSPLVLRQGVMETLSKVAVPVPP
jgi:hypothetical protein